MGKIILYYKYIDIENTQEILEWQQKICQPLDLKGRIIIAHEGINGTLGGSKTNIELYKKAMLEHSLFKDIDFKESIGSQDCFPRLKIVIKKEIVHLGLDTKKYTAKNSGIHLTPEQAHKLIENKPENLVLFDVRNDYESRVGTFQNAILPNTRTFRELPEFIDKNLEKFKNKQVLMFCTGGVRCERASSYLKSKKVAKKVYQIAGGIHRYIEKFPDGFFKGKNYVFDDRITLKATDDILSKCEHCAISYDTYTNCINTECNKQIIVCQKCKINYKNTCSTNCLNLVNRNKVNLRKIFRSNPIENTAKQD